MENKTTKKMINELLKMRIKLRQIEKANESFPLFNSLKMKSDYYTAKKLRKKTEKAIFKILENGNNN